MQHPSHTFTPSSAEALEELRMHSTSGRADRYWPRPFEEGIEAIFGLTSLPLELWSQIDWYGPLEQWRGPEAEVSDILFNGPPASPIFVVQRGAMTDTNVTLHPTWVSFIQRQLLLRSRKLHPQSDCEQWPPEVLGVADRLRYAITTEPFSRDGPTFALRLLPERWRTLDDLVHGNMLSRDAANLLLNALRAEASVIVAGSTGTGKTTLAAAIIQEIGKTARLVVVEDGGELPRTNNSVHLEATSEGDAFSQAVRFSLRQKPKYVVVGEVRGGEAIALLQGAATGHPGISTIHANDVQTALRNLERNAMLGLAAQAGGGAQAAAAIARGLITTTNLVVVHIGITPRGRRSVLAVAEVLLSGSQGQSGDKFPTNTLFEYDSATDQLMRTGNVQLPWGSGRY
jgi:pilus assembly protein CpaF